MSESLQDQLKALGLAKSQPARRKKPKKPRKAQKKGNAELSLDQAYRLRQKEEKQSAQQKKEQKRLQDLERRRINKQIQKLVDSHKLNDAKAEIKRNFLYKGRIRSVLVTPEQLKALNTGELGVVFLRGNYIVMKPEHIEMVKAISEDHVPDLGGDEPEYGEDDQHKVPDDLVW